MKIAIVGSRDLIVKNLAHYLPPSDRITEIVSGGASVAGAGYFPKRKMIFPYFFVDTACKCAGFVI